MNHDPRVELVGSNALRVTTEAAVQLAEHFGNEARLESDGKLLVRFSLQNANKLALAGFDPPTPFRLFYKWNVAPYGHQPRTAEFITAHLRCGVWNEQGTGKTIAASAAVDYLHARGAVRRILVLAPVSVLYSAWANDLMTAAPHLSVGVAYGPAAKRIAVFKSGCDVVVMNFDGLGSTWETILDDGRFDMIVIDEANAFKNSQTQRFKLLSKIIKQDTRIVLMTGTPASQSPLDAYGLSKLLGNPDCPKYSTAWRDRVMNQITRFKWEPKKDAAELAGAILKPSIRFLKKDCLDLPERVYVTRNVEMSPEQAKLYAALKKEMLVALGGGEIVAQHAGAMLSKLMQISSGAVYDSDHVGRVLDYTPRYKVLREIIDGTDRKVIVFANFRPVIDELVRRLNDDGTPTACINGDTSAEMRRNLFFQFQNTDYLRVLVIQPQAAAHGVTLTAADTTVWWGPPSSVEMYKQANDRFHRIGQEHRCTVFHLTGSIAEDKVFANLKKNLSVHESIVSLFSDIARS